MRPYLRLGLALAVGALTSCGPKEIAAPFCFNIDGHCNSGNNGNNGSGPVSFDWITGFPYDKVGPDRPNGDGSWGQLVPGDSVTLHVLFGVTPFSGPADTVRTVAWAVSDTGVARITDAAGGGGRLVAVAPGEFNVTANGFKYEMWTCFQNTCTRIGQIRVTAPPAH